MIIYKDGRYESCTKYPDTLYDNTAIYCIPDNSNLAQKYMVLYPHVKLVTDDNNTIVDVIAIETEVTIAEQMTKLKLQFNELDQQSIRPLRAILSGIATDEDKNKLKELETQVMKLREQFTELNKEIIN